MKTLDEQQIATVARWFLSAGIAGLAILAVAGAVAFFGLSRVTVPAEQAFVRTAVIASQSVHAQSLSQFADEMATAPRVGDVFRIRNEMDRTLTAFEKAHEGLMFGDDEIGLLALDAADQTTILAGNANSLDIAIGDVSRTLRTDFLGEVASPDRGLVQAVKDRIRYDILPKLAALSELQADVATRSMQFLLAMQLAVGAAILVAGALIWLAVHGVLARKTLALIAPDASPEEEKLLRSVDPYTNLPNQGYLVEKIVQHRDLHWRQNGLSVIVALRFSNLDDLYEEHDRTRRAMVQRAILDQLAKLVRAGDALAITGPDSFALLCGPLDERSDINPTLHAFLDHFEAPFEFEHQEVLLKPSLGVSTVTKNARNPAQPIAEAGAACAISQTAGLGRVVGFHAHIARYPDHAKGLGEDIAEALGNDMIEVMFDPVLDGATGAMSHLIAQPQMSHKILGDLLPLEFEEMAWSTGNGKDLLRFMATEALGLREVAAPMGGKPGRIMLRLPTSAITMPGLLDTLKWAADTTEQPLDALALQFKGGTPDILESSEVVAAFYEISSAGIGLYMPRSAIADAKPVTLRDIGMNGLVIDRALIANIDNVPLHQMAVTTLSRNAERTDTSLIAEHVTTADERDALLRLGVRHMQGPFFGRPMSKGALALKLSKQPSGQVRPTQQRHAKA